MSIQVHKQEFQLVNNFSSNYRNWRISFEVTDLFWDTAREIRSRRELVKLDCIGDQMKPQAPN